MLEQQFTAAIAVLSGLVIVLLVFKLCGNARKGTGGSRTAKPARTKPKDRQQNGYSRAEVAPHKKEGDLWLIIKNKGSDCYKVYDVTDYVDEHPGGDAIFTHAGGDATQGFLGPQHPPTTYDLLEEYCIGWLTDP